MPGVEYPLALGTDWTQLQLFENVLIADLGPEQYSGLWTGATGWNVLGIPEAVDDYGRLLDFANPDYSGLEWDKATQLVIDGDAAYNVMGDWAEAAFEQAGLTYDDEYTTFPTPGTDGRLRLPRRLVHAAGRRSARAGREGLAGHDQLGRGAEGLQPGQGLDPGAHRHGRRPTTRRTSRPPSPRSPTTPW